jgi:hypothetical protein
MTFLFAPCNCFEDISDNSSKEIVDGSATSCDVISPAKLVMGIKRL